MRPYHQCKGKLHGGPKRCWHRGVVVVDGRYYCRKHDPTPRVDLMDEMLKTVMTKVAEHTVRLAGGSEGKALAIANRASDFLLMEVRRIVDESTKKKKI
jgi:hypothetical protein